MMFIVIGFAVVCLVGAIVLFTMPSSESPKLNEGFNKPNVTPERKETNLHSGYEGGPSLNLSSEDKLKSFNESSEPITSMSSMGGNFSPMTSIEILFGFEGRINRTQWWTYNIGMFFGVLFFAVIVAVMKYPMLYAQIVLAIPSTWIVLALDIKRWHDRDKSGWWWFITFIPFIGGIWRLVELGFLSGTAGSNNFGQSSS